MRAPLRRSGDPGGGGNDLLLLLPSAACFGEGCEAIEPWPVHHVRHRNNALHRLCTSCVLKLHPGHFCCSCFEVFDSPDRPRLVHCSKCPSVAHLRCLPDPTLANLFLCPACDSPSPTSFSYFPFSKNSADRVIDLRAAKILLAAARLSAASMSRAAAIARADAEKKVKEAGLARKRAREMLDGVLLNSEKEKKTVTFVAAVADAASVEGVEPKKKTPRPSATPSITLNSGMMAQKRSQEREREKWKRFSEPIGLVNRSTLATGRNEKIKAHLNLEGKDIVVKDEKEKKGIFSGSQDISGKDQ